LVLTGLAHLPSGKFMANAAWLTLTVIARNLARAVGQLAGPDLDTATAATLRRKVFTMPGRIVRGGRHRRLRLPEGLAVGGGHHHRHGAHHRDAHALLNITSSPDQDLGEAGRPPAPARPHRRNLRRSSP